jgi:hypothetical protein
LWSYNWKQDEFVVSPQPDVSVLEIDVHSHRCLILGTDGLSNMLSPQDAVNSVYFAEKNNERQPQPTQGSTDLSKSWINPSKRLVDRALDRWQQHGLRADNTSVVTVVVDPPGPPKVKCFIFILFLYLCLIPMKRISLRTGSNLITRWNFSLCPTEAWHPFHFNITFKT